MPHGELNARRPQTMQPAAQQRRGFHVFGKDPARTADKGVYAQAFSPLAHLSSAEVGQQGLQRGGAVAVARVEGDRWLGMREVQAAFARQQKLATDRWHGVKHLHRQRRASARQNFSGHQARRAATDDSHAADSSAG